MPSARRRRNPGQSHPRRASAPLASRIAGLDNRGRSPSSPKVSSMNQPSPLWPANLDHIRLDSPEPEQLARFYRDAMGMAPSVVGEGLWLLSGPERRLLIGRGEKNGHPFAAFRLAHEEQLDSLRRFAVARGFEPLPAPTPLFADGAFALRDPDGWLIVFGLPRADVAAASSAHLPPARLPGRLQHDVVATADLERLTRFYVDGLGFLVADTVREGEQEPFGPATARFFRADVEHHSFAAFRAPEARGDHHAYETTCWNDIRDWLDHFGDLGVTPWWGPGRHGVGRNLFFMVKDPDGNNVELSAEIEIMPKAMPGRVWPHTMSTLNRWGVGWMRS